MELIPFAFPGLPQVGCAFTTRLGGMSRTPFSSANLSHDVGDSPSSVAHNRENLARHIGVAGFCELRQVHGDVIRAEPTPMSPANGGELPGDGLFTSRPGAALVVKTADCQPLLLAHASGRHIMALHVGWRGNVLNLPGRGVASFCAAYGLDPAQVLAVRGPSLSPGASEFLNFEAEFGAPFREFYDPGTRTVDLWALTRSQLLAAGLKSAHIFGVDLCTKSLPELFFSYRGEKTTGRQAGLIWIKD